MRPNPNPNPTLYEVMEALAENIGRYIELQYDRLFERKWQQECLYFEPEDQFKGFTGRDMGEVFVSKEGNVLFRTYFITRRDVATKEYLPRSLRLEGIRLDTVFVGNGSQGKVRLFPNVPQDFKVRA